MNRVIEIAGISFNSTMVRLKALDKAVESRESFNSTMVRLKDDIAEELGLTKGSFNSTMVRLKESSLPRNQV